MSQLLDGAHARYRPDQPRMEGLRLLTALCAPECGARWAGLGQDLEQFRKLADYHRIAALLLDRLQRAGTLQTLPAKAAAWLRGERLRQTALWLGRRADLERVANAFSAQQLPLVLLKGAYLSEFVYATPALRPMADLDLMVPVERLVDAARLLESLGYTVQAGGLFPAGWRRFHELPPFAKPGATSINLHWRLDSDSDRLHIDDAALWARLQPLPRWPGVYSLAREDVLLHLAVHMSARHGYRIACIALWDLAECLRCWGDRLAWDDAVARAMQWSAGRHLLSALWLAEDLFACGVPPAVLAALRRAEPRVREVTPLFDQMLEEPLPPASAGSLLAFRMTGRVLRPSFWCAALRKALRPAGPLWLGADEALAQDAVAGRSRNHVRANFRKLLGACLAVLTSGGQARMFVLERRRKRLRDAWVEGRQWRRADGRRDK